MGLDDFDEEQAPATRAFDLSALAREARPREVTGATFSYVDAMLTGRMSPTDLARIRDEILGGAPPPPPPAAPGPLDEARRLLAANDHAGALREAESVLERQPGHAEALAVADECRARLADLYLSHLGRGGDRPRLAVTLDALAEHGIDRWSAYLISRLEDGCTIDDLVDLTGFSRLDTLRVLYEVVQRGIVVIEPAQATSRSEGPSSDGSAVLARIQLERRR